MKEAPSTYEDWLAMSLDEQRRVHFQIWDTNARDGIAIAYLAAARLALTSDRKILNIQIGTYHGGEYLLHMTVSPEDYKNCPPILQDTFEGFRVVWMPASHFEHNDDSDATLEGTWISEDGYYEFKFEACDAGAIVTGKVGGSNSEFLVEHSALNGKFLLFSVFEPDLGNHTRHTFRLVGQDNATDDLTSPRRFTRIK
jgi:hypothetical protein